MSAVLRFTPFDREQQAVLDLYFARGARDPDPSDALHATVKSLAGSFEGGELGERQIDVAVASLILRNLQDDLPSWSYNVGGKTVSTRDLEVPQRRGFPLASQVLLQVNWADSGPGFDWPEQYRLTWVPAPGRFVVTASSDTDESYGYSDVALGHFGKTDSSLADKCRQIITRRWRRQKREHQQEPWEHAEEGGRIPVKEAQAWRASVWGRKAGLLEN